MDIKDISTESLKFAFDAIFDRTLQKKISIELKKRLEKEYFVEEYLTAITEIYKKSNGTLNFSQEHMLKQYTDIFVKNIMTL